ncbi:MAG: hypothetical protein JWM76_1342 [Pseudonocardiales bacterium]|nr:hypothetical protein [Pseudonocardiales bacterium]
MTGVTTASIAERFASAGRRPRNIILGLTLLGLIALAWVAVTALLARTELEHVRAQVPVLRADVESGNLETIGALQKSINSHAGRAHSLTSGPAWWVASSLPWIGAPARTVRGISAQAANLADTSLPAIVETAQSMNPRTLRTGGSSIDVTALSRAAPQVHEAAASLAQVVLHVQNLPTNTWLGSADSARASLLTTLTGLTDHLSEVDDALQVLPTLLGEQAPKRYFVSLQNSAEARGTGGLPGAFAIVTADHGQIRFEHFASDGELDNVSSGLDFGPEYAGHYGADQPFSQYVDSNESPHFPYAAQIWAAMWTAKTGEKVDGAMALDPTALSYLLQVTGPATLPDQTIVSGANVVALTEKEVYAKFPQDLPVANAARRQYFLDIAQASEERLLAGTGDARALLKAAARAATERRLLVWSADPAAEAILARHPVGGTVPDTSQPFSLLSVNNGSGGKLDYYLERSYVWERSACGSKADVKVTITLRNGAPTAGLPAYVVGRKDKPRVATKPGDLLSVLDYFATKGATFQNATLDGTATSAVVYSENGHPVFRIAAELPAGTTHTIVLLLREPTGSQPPLVIAQPLTSLPNITISDACT